MNTNKRLGELLIEAGAITPAQLEGALEYQRKTGGKLGQALIRLRVATEAQVVQALSRKLGYAPVDVARVEPSPGVRDALRLVPRELAERHLLLPIASDRTSITVVMADPTNVQMVDEIAFRTGRHVKVGLAGDSSIAMAIRRLYGPAHDDSRLGVAPGVQPPAPGTAARDARPGDTQGSAPASLEDSLEDSCNGATPVQTLTAVIRVLLQKGVVTQAELVRELRAIVDAGPDSGAVPGRKGFREVG